MKKGFTLIELLAVIVILAIIASIATPIVLSIVKDAKASATLRTAEFYLSAIEQSIAKKSIDTETNYSPNECEIESNGNLYCDKKETLNIDVKGEKPTGGTIIFEDGDVTNVLLVIGDKVITKNKKGELVFGANLIDYIKSIYKPTTITTVNNLEYDLDETHLLMNDRLGSSDVDKTDGNIRYYGANPNNYIDIGDRDSKGNVILWRMVGLFKDMEVTDETGQVTGTEDLVKIIRADVLKVPSSNFGEITKFSGDYKYETATNSNIWKNTTLKALLNDAYYESKTTTYYSDLDNAIVQLKLDFKSEGLSKDAHNKIQSVNWKFGKHDGAVIGYVDVIYRDELASKTNGKVGVMHLSDYGYATDLKECQVVLKNYNASTCTSTNWLHDPNNEQATSAGNSKSSVSSFKITSAGAAHQSNNKYPSSVRPVLYLKSNVNIIGQGKAYGGIKYFVIGE